MKHNEFVRLEEKCPKCQNSLMLQKTSWSDLSGDLQYVFCEPCHCKGNGANDKETALANSHKELARKEKLALRKPEKIITDIRDYLVERKRCLAIESRMCPKIRETALVLSMIEDLQKYAEKLGVEL
jgi:hypothetical protein